MFMMGSGWLVDVVIWWFVDGLLGFDWWLFDDLWILVKKGMTW